MPRFPPHQFHGPNYRPRHQGNNGQYIHSPRRFPGPQQFQSFHHEGARFHAPPHGRGMPPEQFFQRGPRPPYRGGMAGRPDGFPLSAHGHGPPQSQFRGGGFGYQNYAPCEEQFEPQMFHSPTDKSNGYDAKNGANNSCYNRNRGRGRGGGGNSFGQDPQQQGDGKKKNKKAKAPKEINYSHYCDVCDRGFQTDEQLKSHIAEHVKCKEKDCRFVGHPKVVKMHHKLHHGPGSKKIRWLDTPEEIQKWRNERKRNFPTAENIAKKGLKIEQKERQGNVLETKQFGKMKRTHRGKRGQGRFKRKKMAQANESGLGNEVPTEPISSDHIPPKRRKTGEDESPAPPAAEEEATKASDPTQPTKAVETDHSIPSTSSSRPAQTGHSGPMRADDCDPLSLLASLENDSGDEEASGTQGVNPKVEVAPKGTFGALGSLAACYDSDSEGSFIEEHDNATKIHDNRTLEISSQDVRSEQCPAVEDGTNIENLSLSIKGAPAKDTDEARCHDNGMSDERKTISDGGQERNKRFSRKDGRKRKRTPEARGKGAGSQAEQKKATLLEMLLAPEIRKERNIILQCVRQVVKNNFFQDSSL